MFSRTLNIPRTPVYFSIPPDIFVFRSFKYYKCIVTVFYTPGTTILPPAEATGAHGKHGNGDETAAGGRGRSSRECCEKKSGPISM